VLKPGARLLVVDGDFVRDSLRGRMLRGVASLLGEPAPAPGADTAVHQDILSRVHYAEGLTRDRLSADLLAAGFVDAQAHRVSAIYALGLTGTKLAERLRLLAPDRFAVSVRRPA